MAHARIASLERKLAEAEAEERVERRMLEAGRAQARVGVLLQGMAWFAALRRELEGSEEVPDGE